MPDDNTFSFERDGADAVVGQPRPTPGDKPRRKLEWRARLKRLFQRRRPVGPGAAHLRHMSVRLTGGESRRLAVALARAVAALPQGDLANDDRLLATARGFARDRLLSCAPNLQPVLTAVRRGDVDSFFISWKPFAFGESRLFSAVMACAVGEPFNYATQNDGAIVMRIEPKEGSGANTQTTRGEFEYHSDDAAVARCCRVEWILLTGIFNPSRTSTWYCSVATAVTSLDETTIRVLSELRYSVRAPLSFNLPTEVWTGARAILSRDAEGRLEIAWPSYATRPIDPNDQEAAKALADLKAAVVDHGFGVTVGPGCLLGLSNVRGVHKRDAIEFGERLLLRTYSRDDLEDLRRQTGEPGPVFDVRKTL